MEEIGGYKIHEYASRLPMMPEDQFEILKENIRTQGLLHPIVTLDKEPVVIDGRNRLRACIELEIDPEFITLGEFLNGSIMRRGNTMATGDLTGLCEAEQSGDLDSQIKELILMENVYRRHLTDFNRFLNLKAVEGYPEHGIDRGNQYKEVDAHGTPTLSDIATKLGKSERTIQRMQWLDENAPDDIKQALLEGELSVRGAYDEVKKKREKKPDWFDQNIEDPFERAMWREVVKVKRRMNRFIEKELGEAHRNEFTMLFNKIHHDKYKEEWKEVQ